MPLSGCAPASRPSQAPDATKPVAKAVQACTGNGCCSGLGMSAQPNVDEFVKDFKQLQSDWPKLTADEREQRLEALANRQLAKSGVPKVGVVPKTLPKGNGGHLDFNNWQLAVNKDQLSAATLSDAEAKALANTVYHESRHAEQWYLMAQRRAMNGDKASDIRDSMSIPGSVATAAEQRPLVVNSTSAACAQVLHDSVYGTNAAARNTTLTGVMTELGKLNQANAAVDSLNANPASTPAQKTEAAQNAVAARAAFDTAYQKYRALPEEADAFEAGDKVDKAW